MKYTEFPEKITATFVLNGKLYVTTASRTYRLRERKRHRGKNKPQSGFVRQLLSHTPAP